MDSTIFLEIDEKLQNTDMALDELLRMKLPNEAKDAINMIIENLTSVISMVSSVKEQFIQLEGGNQRLTKVIQEAKKQFREIDLENS